MPLIAGFTAKALACIDAFAGFFVTATDTSALYHGMCANLVVLNAEITPCGRSFLEGLYPLIEVGTWAVWCFLIPFLSGLLAN